MRRRYATLATVSRTCGVDLTSPDGSARVVALAETYLVRARRMGAELVAFTEVFPQSSTPNLLHHAEPADGGTLPRVCELARKLKLHIVWPHSA
jgi:predicted amidohydrolase